MVSDPEMLRISMNESDSSVDADECLCHLKGADEVSYWRLLSTKDEGRLGCRDFLLIILSGLWPDSL